MRQELRKSSSTMLASPSYGETGDVITCLLMAQISLIWSSSSVGRACMWSGRTAATTCLPIIRCHDEMAHFAGQGSNSTRLAGPRRGQSQSVTDHVGRDDWQHVTGSGGHHRIHRQGIHHRAD